MPHYLLVSKGTVYNPHECMRCIMKWLGCRIVDIDYEYVRGEDVCRLEVAGGRLEKVEEVSYINVKSGLSGGLSDKCHIWFGDSSTYVISKSVNYPIVFIEINCKRDFNITMEY